MKPPIITPIDWRLIRGVLWQWVADAAGVEAIWANQNAPQPSYPYASINILPGTIGYGALDEQRFLDDGTLRLVGPRDFVLSIQIHSGPEADDPNCNALSRAHAVIASIAIPEFQRSFQGANISARERGQVQMLDLEVGTDWIRRAMVDVRFVTMSVVDVRDWPNLHDVGWFDKVEVSSDIIGLDPDSGLNLDDELLDPNA